MDKSKIYTSVNADELEEGDVVFVADTWAELQRRERGQEITHILDSTYMSRFEIGNCAYALAYLIAKHDDPYKEFKRAVAGGKKVWFKWDDGSWRQSDKCDFTYPIDRYSLTSPAKEYKVFLDACFVYTDGKVPEGKHVYYITSDSGDASRWCTEHNKFAEVAKAWEEGATIEFFSPCIGWTLIKNPVWCTVKEYRVKPASLKWTDLKVGDVISNDRFISLVVCIDQGETDRHIRAGNSWLTDDELESWRKV